MIAALDGLNTVAVVGAFLFIGTAICMVVALIIWDPYR